MPSAYACFAAKRAVIFSKGTTSDNKSYVKLVQAAGAERVIF
jgi:hypothetical protein